MWKWFSSNRYGLLGAFIGAGIPAFFLALSGSTSSFPFWLIGGLIGGAAGRLLDQRGQE